MGHIRVYAYVCNSYILSCIYVSMKRANTRNKTSASGYFPSLDLHQCRQCGLVYHSSAEPVFSWDRRFMIDKCGVCRDFR